MGQTRVQLVGDVFPGANFAGVVTATENKGNTLSANVATIGNIIISSGIITATSGIVTFYGDGSKLNGIVVGSAITNDISSNEVLYLPFTQQTSATLTSTPISTQELSYNPSQQKLDVGIAITFTRNNISISGSITATNISIPLGLG